MTQASSSGQFPSIVSTESLYIFRNKFVKIITEENGRSTRDRRRYGWASNEDAHWKVNADTFSCTEKANLVTRAHQTEDTDNLSNPARETLLMVDSCVCPQ